LHTVYISVIYLATAGDSIQNRHVQYTSHMPAQVFSIAQPLALSYNHWYRYRYTYRYRCWKKVSGIGSIGKSWYLSQPTSSTSWLLVWSLLRLDNQFSGTVEIFLGKDGSAPPPLPLGKIDLCAYDCGLTTKHSTTKSAFFSKKW